MPMFIDLEEEDIQGQAYPDPLLFFPGITIRLTRHGHKKKVIFGLQASIDE